MPFLFAGLHHRGDGGPCPAPANGLGKERVLPRYGLASPNGPNQRWSLDFVSDALAWGRKFHILAVVDVFTREALALVPRHRGFDWLVWHFQGG